MTEWDRYIRELAMFGANAVEVIPPVSDDEPDSDHFPLLQIDMLREVSAIADRYDIDLWVWFPALESDYGEEGDGAAGRSPTGGRCSRRCRASTRCSSRAAIPDRLPARLLLALAERQKASLREVHPRAQMWIAPQGLSRRRRGALLRGARRRRSTGWTG